MVEGEAIRETAVSREEKYVMGKKRSWEWKERRTCRDSTVR